MQLPPGGAGVPLVARGADVCAGAHRGDAAWRERPAWWGTPLVGGTLRHPQMPSSAQELLRKGMEALSQAEVASALQVFFNLGCLREVPPPASPTSCSL